MSKNDITRGDYISLSKAVTKFNKKLNELRTKENEDYLPREYNYLELKDRIKGKNEIQRVIKNLKNFNNADLYITESEEKITAWEHNVLEQERKIALRRMQNKLDKNASRYDQDTIDSLKWNIENLKNFNKLKDRDFRDAVERIHKIGVKDYDLKKLITYRENYYAALQEIQNYKNYVKFKNRIDRIKDPQAFYDFIQKSETMKNLFVFYKGGDGLVLGAFSTNEDAFDYALEEDYNMKVG